MSNASSSRSTKEDNIGQAMNNLCQEMVGRSRFLCPRFFIMKTAPLHSPDRSQLRHCSFLIALGQRVALPLFLLCAALFVQPCAATPFQWEYTGYLNNTRAYHTATLLLNGKVLVAGGDAGSGYSAGTLRPSHRNLDPHRQPQYWSILPHGDVTLRWQGARGGRDR